MTGPDAYSTPPPDGSIVVSAGLLRALDPGEREVLFAHESSHLAHGHAWWVMAADLAAAVNPIRRRWVRRRRRSRNGFVLFSPPHPGGGP